jgi:hypothetical protein
MPKASDNLVSMMALPAVSFLHRIKSTTASYAWLDKLRGSNGLFIKWTDALKTNEKSTRGLLAGLHATISFQFWVGVELLSFLIMTSMVSKN